MMAKHLRAAWEHRAVRDCIVEINLAYFWHCKDPISDCKSPEISAQENPWDSCSPKTRISARSNSPLPSVSYTAHTLPALAACVRSASDSLPSRVIVRTICLQAHGTAAYQIVWVNLCPDIPRVCLHLEPYCHMRCHD